jgi:GT2 family glycosyltransferase
MGIRKSVFKFFGGFDETVPYLFDTEFCFRVQLAGYNLHFVPDAVLHMRRPENLIDFFRKAQNFGKYHVLLYKRFRFSGMPVISWKTGVKAWINQLLLQPLKIRTRNDIARFLWNLGWRIGWVKGCFQFRILVP